MSTDQNRLPLILAFVFMVAVWSCTPLAMVWSQRGVGPLASLFWRCLLAALLCSAAIAALRLRVPLDRTSRRAYVIAGSGMLFPSMCSYIGIVGVGSGLTSVIYGTTPLITGLMLYLFGERLSGMRWLAILVGFAGLATVCARLPAHLDPGLLALVICGACFFAVGSVLVSRHSQGLHPLVLAAATLWFGAIGLLPAVWLHGESLQVLPQGRAAGAILFAAVFGSFGALLCNYYLLRRLSPTHVNLSTLITPVGALWIGHAFNREALNTSMWIGSVVILLGLVLYFAAPAAQARRGEEQQAALAD